MKFLLVAVNARYIHSNLGVYSLKAYGDQQMKDLRPFDISIGEYTINHSMDLVLKDIYQRRPDAVGLSCYIWNVDYMLSLVRDLKKILPQCDIWLGGPEISYDPFELLRRAPEVSGIMRGEGEETFAQLMEFYVNCKREAILTGKMQAVMNQLTAERNQRLSRIAGLVYRDGSGQTVETSIRPVMDMSRIPFSYKSLTGLEHKIIYYESSRGCPYSCSYCLSSLDKTVRFRDLALVKEELNFFLEHQVPQVKFVDRTFNCKKSHAMAVWRHILDHDNGVTNFHFEISADLLDEEELALIRQMRPGLIQLEIGVQTTNRDSIREIHRTMDLKRLSWVVETINGYGNVHQHLDLIAGLPYEGYDSFKQSFQDVYAMRPEQLQLGFLKVLKGSYMEEMAGSYGLIYKGKPPYEVLSTNWLDYGEVLKLKAVEEMVEVYYNSGQFNTTVTLLEREFSTAFDMYEKLADEYESKGLFELSHNRLARYEILFSFIRERFVQRLEEYRDSLMYDLYLRENIKSRPSFARDQSPYKSLVREFFLSEAADPQYLTDYEGYDWKQISKMAHVEVMGDGSMVLFDYWNRNPLNYNAKAVKISIM